MSESGIPALVQAILTKALCVSNNIGLGIPLTMCRFNLQQLFNLLLEWNAKPLCNLRVLLNMYFSFSYFTENQIVLWSFKAVCIDEMYL